ncbi:MAG: signal peptidase II [Tissierellia bacterium]|nr:signal peptidase II [Tissierellia bacterium]
MQVLIVLLIVVLDQISKFAAVKYLKGQKPYTIIKNFFQFEYVENYGAAFGILQNRKIFFIITTTLVIVAITITFVRYSNKFNKPMNIALSMLLGGAIGNFIDRIRLSYVIDFISVRFGNGYDFPVFNIADMFIVIGTFLIAIMVTFDIYEYR